jgi:hypothetical protein
MRIGRLGVLALIVAIGLGGIGMALAQLRGGDDPSAGAAIELRKDDVTFAEQDDDGGDGDDTAGDDGTAGGNNTGDGDATRGNDGTRGGDNSYGAAAPAPAADDGVGGGLPPSGVDT